MTKKALLLCLAFCCHLTFAATIVNNSDGDLAYRFRDIHNRVHIRYLPAHQSIVLKHLENSPIYIYWYNKDIDIGQGRLEWYDGAPEVQKNDVLELTDYNTVLYNGIDQ